MTRTDTPAAFADPHATLARILAELGARRTFAALLRALIAARRPPPRKPARRGGVLCNHLRRDIGLPPVPKGLPSRHRLL